MSLYAGLIPNDTSSAEPEGEKKDAEGAKATDASGWLASKHLMAPQLLRKKQTNAAAPQIKPAVRQAVLSAAMVPNTPTELPAEPFYHAEFSLVPVENEYDPFRPNDYETVLEEREERKRKKKEEEEAERRRRRERKEGRSERDRHHDFAPPMPAPIPQPSNEPAQLNLNESAAEAIARRLRMSGKPVPAATPPSQPKGSGESYGARLLGQMGWKEGSGLGKSEQGMATPLTVEKTGKAKGVIVQSLSNTLMTKATRVILLENMVGPGEVDDDLQPEVAEECSKFGKVTKCLVFEVPGGQVPDDQAVRIFVEFDRVESARKGVLSLNGRFFGGRTVRASFYDEAKFARFDLAPDL